MNARRSTRIATGAATNNLRDQSEDEDMNDIEFVAEDPGVDEPPAEKKPRAKKRKAPANSKQGGRAAPKKFRGIRGKLEGMNDMPLDIWNEIFMYLQPIDLLHLTRTNKDLRKYLMSRSSTMVWKTARSTIIPAMPECPDDLSEPAYAELAFGKGCHYCQRKVGTIHTAWYARRRICNHCIYEECKQNCAKPPSIYELFGNFDFESYLPKITVDTAPKSRRSRYERTFYFVEFFARWTEKAKTMATMDERKLWIQRTQTAAHQHAHQCASWSVGLINHQRTIAIQQVESRRELVAERVAALGWTDEVAKMERRFKPYFQNLPATEKLYRKELTDQNLAELDPVINKYMEDIKHQRLEQERTVLLSERLAVLKKVYTDFASSVPSSDKALSATAVEIFMEPSIQDIIVNLPKEQKLTEEDLLPTLVAIFPDVNKRIRKSIDDQLLAHAVTAYKEAGGEYDLDPATVFDLVTTLFHCSSCSKQFGYDLAVAHECTRKNSLPKDLPDVDIISRSLGAIGSYRTHAKIIVDVDGMAYIREALKLCGLDPSNTTKKMMDDLNPIFECLLCNEETKGRATMTWARAFRHRFEYVHRNKKSEELARMLVLLHDEEANVVQARIAEIVDRGWANQSYPCHMVCAHCGANPTSKSSLIDHVRSEHAVKKPAFPRDMIPDPNIDHTANIFYMWPPRRDASEEPIDAKDLTTTS
ncbi:hypothetical protein HYPSUDRAFT_42500 [Hypholoma sublateritium FD-334 SS-4]|uniref:F-box domain-containing protein n=1 Tax=Hypholoma sublateritium (strain FD-334 SS-4) TaxID=945553 RepID=A0A0D2NQQ6_HYPSF|nr:hypothetical protein HYPSUDRAFT_42500 [Hypholoma sublateritium FD-334 SS-4]